MLLASDQKSQKAGYLHFPQNSSTCGKMYLDNQQKRGRSMLRELSMATTIWKIRLQRANKAPQGSPRVPRPVSSSWALSFARWPGLSITVFPCLCPPSIASQFLSPVRSCHWYPWMRMLKDAERLPAWYSLLEGFVRRSHILSLR